MAQNQMFAEAPKATMKMRSMTANVAALGAGSEQSGDRSGRAFVNVRPVNLERRGDHFESQPHKNQAEAQHGERQASEDCAAR